MNIEWIQTLYTAITIFFASIVHGIAGFGLAQLSMGVLPFFRSVSSAAAIFSIVAIVSNFQVWWSCKDDFQPKDLIKPVIGLAAGMPLGIFVFNQLDEKQIKTVIGVVLILAVILIVLGKQTSFMEDFFKGRKYKPKTILPISVGFIAGVLGGAVAIPGPPMILYGALMTSAGLWTNRRMKSVFTSFFGILMAYRAIAIFIQGGITQGIMVEALISIPAMMLGAFIGIKIFDKISSKTFNWVIIVMLALNGIVLLVK
nr:sulfite exporter TauE/SafE family protein [Tissierella sp.]